MTAGLERGEGINSLWRKAPSLEGVRARGGRPPFVVQLRQRISARSWISGRYCASSPRIYSADSGSPAKY